MDENEQQKKEKVRKERIDELAAKATAKLLAQKRKLQKLDLNLNSDLEKHGDPDVWKRYGDLILANASSAIRDGDEVIVTDYFDDAAPRIRIAGERQLSLNEIAESYFRAYTKARNGKRIIAERLTATKEALVKADSAIERIGLAVSEQDEAHLESLTQPRKLAALALSGKKKRSDTEFKGARRFISTDGLEILVGKKASDNDLLTFRVAKSLDLWLHAADYPGSHVIIRGHGKKAVPDRTLLEAAQLAAFYSDARDQPKAAVRYTQRKFVSKPRKGGPGLVSLSTFKTILVEPKVGIQMVRDGQ